MGCSTPGFPVLHHLLEFAQSLSIESVMPSNHLILCHSLLLLPSIFPGTRVFSNESVLRIRWPKYWSFCISPSNEYSGLISFRFDWFDLLAVQGTLRSLLVFSNTTVWKHQFFGAQSSLWSNSHITPPWIEPKVSVLSFKVQVKLISFLRVYLDALAHIISILINPHCLTLSKWLY